MEKVQDEKGSGSSNIFGEEADKRDLEVQQNLKADAAATELLVTAWQSECLKCAIGEHCKALEIPQYNFVKGHGSEDPDVLVVLPEPEYFLNTSSTQQSLYVLLLSYVASVVPKEKIRVSFALRCRTSGVERVFTNDIKPYITACREYIENEINLYNPKIVILPHPISVYSVLRKSDIHYEKYFGSIIKRDGRYYICTSYPKQDFRKQVRAHIDKIPYLLEGGIQKDTTLKTKILKTHEDVDKVLKFLTDSCLPIVFDIETGTNIESEVAGFADTDTLLGVGISWAENKSVFIPVDHDESPFKNDLVLKEKLKAFFVGENPKCAHNALYDVYGLMHFLDGVKVNKLVFDTMLAHHVINPTRGTHGLKYLITQHTKFGGYEEQIQQVLAKLPKDERSYAKLDLESLGTYCNYDCIGTYILWELFDKYFSKNEELQRVFEEITFPCHELMLDLKSNPWVVDEKKLETLKVYYEQKHKELSNEIQDFISVTSSVKDLNLNSPSQLAKYFENDLGLQLLVRTKKGAASTSKEAIEELRNALRKQKHWDDKTKNILRFLDSLLTFRMCEKIKSTYIEGLSKHIVNGKIYTEYLISGTETARLSSRKPNMQNVHGSSLDGTKESSIKSIFVAPKGFKFVIADYSQIELRNLANITQDDNLIMAFLNNVNNHKATAGLLFGLDPDEVDNKTSMYRVGKMINFAVVYGASPKKLAIELGKVGLTYDELVQLAEAVGLNERQVEHLEVICRGIINTLYSKWTKVNKWQYRVKQEARKFKKTVTPFGRVRYLHEYTPGGKKVNILNQAINTPIQSVSSDCLLIALVAINKILKERGYKSYMVGTVHDSGVFYVHEDEQKEVLEVIKTCMEDEPVKFNPEFFVVPLKVEFEIGTNWANTEPIEIV